MSEFIGIIAALICIILIGLIVQELILGKYIKGYKVKTALALGVGSTAVSLQMLLYDHFSIVWMPITLLMPWGVIFLFNLKKIFSNVKSAKMGLHIPGKLGLLLLLLISSLLIFSLVHALIRPVVSWDAIASWYLGGKAFFIHKSIQPEYFSYVLYDYPPLMHLLLAFVNTFQTKFNDTYSLLYYYLFFPSLLLLFYCMVRERVGRNTSLMLVFLLGSTQNILRHAGKYDIGNADLPLSYFFLVTVFFLLQYRKTKYVGFVILGVLSAVASGLIKNDGLPFALASIGIFSYLLFKNKHFKQMLLIPLLVSPLLYWKVYSQIHGLPGTYLNFYNFKLERYPIIVTETIQEFSNIRRWNLSFLFIIASFFNLKKHPHLYIVFILLVVQFMSYIYVYFVTPIEVASHMRNSFDRLLLHIFPIALYVSFLVIFGKPQKSNLR